MSAPKHYSMAPRPQFGFRSTLEYQWALTWQKLKIPWIFEPFQEDIGAVWGGKYTPDFWLYGHKVWVEIKPAGLPLLDEWCMKAYGLQRARNEAVIFIQGPPIERWFGARRNGLDVRGDWGLGVSEHQVFDALGVPVRDWDAADQSDIGAHRARPLEVADYAA